MPTRLIALAAVPLAACGALTAPQAVVNAPSGDWREIATRADRERLRDWRGTFLDALRRARAAGHGAAIDAEGPLLQPDAALGGPPIPNGDYKCRVIKLGARSAGLLDYVAYPGFTCRIAPDRGKQGFAKLSGSQRPVGAIFAGTALHQVFLGTLVLSDEQRAMEYGRDPDRDMAAWVERVGPARWRMVFPRPAYESITDVIELVPVGG